MRALGPTLVLSFALWASLAWCFVVARTLLGHDHLHLCAREFGIYLLLIDVAFAAAIVWHDHLKPRGG